MMNNPREEELSGVKGRICILEKKQEVDLISPEFCSELRVFGKAAGVEFEATEKKEEGHEA